MNPQLITLTTANPPLTVTALRGQTAPVVEQRQAGWNLVARPRRKSLTQWDGIDPLPLVLSLILDGVADDTTVEPDCDALERMAQPVAEGTEPPLVRTTGVLPHSATDWIIALLEWDPEPIYSRSGYRTRQEVTVHLVEYVADDRLSDQPAAERARRQAAQKAAAAAKASGARSTQQTKAKLYVVRSGDTLASIAARVLGSYKRWPELAALNGLRDPDTLHVGQTLRLP